MNATTTIIITPFCPLHCRYCNLEEDMNAQQKSANPELSYGQIENLVQKFLDNNANAESWTVTLTGGEPFLRWPDIKKLIEKFGDKVTWDFNTSGYLLTEEMLEWLSNYKVRWNLSVDGGEKVTNYLRPLRNPNSTAPTYFQKLKEIVPALTYYFPQVYCKVIISRRLIKEFYNSWLELERIGFKKMFIILDFTEREDENHDTTWTDEDFFELQKQLNKVAEQLYIGMRRGIQRLQIIQFDELLEGMLDPRPIGPYQLICEVLDDRTVASVFDEKSKKEPTKCYSGLGFVKKDFEKQLQEDFDNANGKCVNDPDCPFFNACARRTCVRDNISIRGNAWAPEWAFCKLERLCGNAAVYFLDLCNKYCPDSKEYQRYLRSLLKEGED